MLKKIEFDELVCRIENLPSNQMLYLHTTEDITDGPTYGLMVTEAFETRMYLLCSLGSSHCKAISCNDSMRGEAERNAIKSMLQSCRDEAGLSCYFLDEGAESSKGDIVPVLTTLVRIREEGRHREVFTDTYVVAVPKDMEPYQHHRYVEKQLRTAAQALLAGEKGDECIRQSCRDFNWGDFAMWFEGNPELGVYLPEEFPFRLHGAETLDLSVNQDEFLLEDELDATLYIDQHNGAEPVARHVLASTRDGAVEFDELGSVKDIMESDTLWLDFGNGVRHPVAYDQPEMEEDEEHFAYYVYREDL